MNLKTKKESLLQQHQDLTKQINRNIDLRSRVLGALELIEQIEEEKKRRRWVTVKNVNTDAIVVIVALVHLANAKIVIAKKKNKSLRQTIMKMTTVNHAEHKCHLNLKNNKPFYGLKNLR